MSRRREDFGVGANLTQCDQRIREFQRRNSIVVTNTKLGHEG